MPKGKDTVEIKRWVVLPNGERKRRSFYGATLERAEAEWRAAEQPALADPDFAPGTFAWWLADRYKPLKEHLEANTRANLFFAIRHLGPEIGHLRVDEINATVLASALTRIAAKKTPRSRHIEKAPDGTVRILREWNHKPLAASSVNRCRTVALEVMAIAAESKAAEPINSRRVPKRKEPALEIEPYDPREIRALWQRSRGTIAEVPVLLMGFLGLTVNEALAVDKEDLTPQGTLAVQHHMKRTGDRSRNMKNEFRPRHLPLPPGLVEALQPHLFGTGPMCRDSQEDAGRATEDNVGRSVEAKMRLAGLRRLTLHGLRHSFSSWLEENGCPRAVRLRLMGQSRKGVSDRYNHSSEAALRDWLGRLWDASLLPFDDGAEPVVQEPGRSGPKVPATGERHGRAKLDEARVREILERVRPKEEGGGGGGEGDASVARDYGVDPQAIRQIRLGLTWKSVPRDAA